uniref:Uncharacterized protein n=1 Tax=Timema genevievae TaxID=629358 RepID=A0A7R9K1F9_TIMGE|nr:unnamed protein product [Timema genevievae]
MGKSICDAVVGPTPDIVATSSFRVMKLTGRVYKLVYKACDLTRWSHGLTRLSRVRLNRRGRGDAFYYMVPHSPHANLRKWVRFESQSECRRNPITSNTTADLSEILAWSGFQRGKQVLPLVWARSMSHNTKVIRTKRMKMNDADESKMNNGLDYWSGNSDVEPDLLEDMGLSILDDKSENRPDNFLPLKLWYFMVVFIGFLGQGPNYLVLTGL